MIRNALFAVVTLCMYTGVSAASHRDAGALESELAGQWGKIHVRVQGPSTGPTAILVHQFPTSLVQFNAVQSILAQRGIRTIALDLPGFGTSDAPPFPPERIPSAEEYSETLSRIYRSFGLHLPFLVGTNTGASMIVAFADAHPNEVRGLIIDGPPLFASQEIPGLLAKNRPSDLNSPSKGWYAHDAIYRYNMRDAIKRLKVPALIIAYPGQVLYQASLELKSLRPDFEFCRLDSRAMVASLDNASEWSAVIADYVLAHSSGNASTERKDASGCAAE